MMRRADAIAAGARPSAEQGGSAAEEASPNLTYPEGTSPRSAELFRLPLSTAFRDAWRERHLFYALAAQAVAFRQPRSILGVWWFPIIILFNTVGMTLIFGKVLNVGTGSVVPYFLFACAGTTAWWLFYRGSLFSMRSFHRFRRFVTVFSVPLLLVPFAGVAMTVIFLGFSLVFLFASVLVFWIIDGTLYLNLSPSLMLFPVALVWVATLAGIVGLWSGPVFWRARDVRQLFRLVLPFLMFVTPIVYPLATLEAAVGSVAQFNPLAPPVELLRMAAFGTDGPSTSSVAVGLGITAALLLGGCWFTNRFGYSFLEWQVEDEDDEDL